MRATCVFLNCHNLFEPGTNPQRSNKDAAGIDQQIADLTSTVLSVFGGAPTILALCEVGSEALGKRIGEQMGRRFSSLWSGPPPTGETGLMTLYDPETLTLPDLRYDDWLLESGRRKRARWLPHLFQFREGSKGVFWFVANHWKSRMGGPVSEAERHASARRIGEFYQEFAVRQTGAMLLMGDFNCEPSDGLWVHKASNPLRAVRERSLVLRDRNQLAYFYHPMWRWMGEPDFMEDAMAADYRRSRLIGTHCQDWERDINLLCFDHVLASKTMLLGPAVRVMERSITVTPPKGGASDHAAIGVALEY